MAVALPKRLYWLKLHNPDGRSMLPYRTRGGGKFTQLQAAKDRQHHFWTQHQVISTIYTTQELEWTEIPDDDSLYD